MLPILVRRILAALLSCAAAAVSPAQDLTGAGASFPAPLYAQWADAYRRATGVRVNYQSLGSAAGVKQIAARMVDFGATDAPLSDERLARAGLIQFPMVIGGVVPVVHIAGVQAGQLKLTGPVLGDIYLGKIRRWNDAAITDLNPGLALPDAPIAVVHRADGSGTSFLFSHYLASVSADWQLRVGEGTVVQWPAGSGGKGNEGVALLVKRLPNAIGYVDYATARLSQLAHVQLRNQAGQFVGPGDLSVQAAASGAAWASGLDTVLTDAPGPHSWPIAGVSYVLMNQVQQRPARAAAVLRFFDWAYAGGDPMAQALEYSPLPAAAKTRVRQLWAEQLKDAAGQPITRR